MGRIEKKYAQSIEYKVKVKACGFLPVDETDKVLTDASLWPSWQAEGSCPSSLPCAALTSPSYGLQDALHRLRVTDGQTPSGCYVLTNLTLPWSGSKA